MRWLRRRLHPIPRFWAGVLLLSIAGGFATGWLADRFGLPGGGDIWGPVAVGLITLAADIYLQSRTARSAGAVEAEQDLV